MKQSIFFLLLTLTGVLYASGQYKTPDALAYSQPLQVDSTDYYIFGSFIDKTNKTKYNLNQSYNSRNSSSWTNALIYNSKTNSTKKVFSTSPLLIYPVLTVGLYSYGSQAYNMFSAIIDNNILYLVKSDEYNKDGIIDEDDPVLLFMSSKFGEGLKQITPSDMNLTSWLLSKDRKKVILKLQKDKNGDKKFADEDETFYQIELSDDISKIKFFPINL